ncbi:major facilitator superfamily domain-containing protein [Dunaliella salina]|uniref:Major facilitator superfamily domain-containing protein n=1 Tax=Dunaliella salina TaxID=3046 RepID=A0ABQ7H3Z2_DUNSA|nr:major facilitator superfamily domain-containing protein [Dunaliella salina]|eukprot:KAF5841577.1 major facilitator superfamily domain-containing protein [Dunaliella salina]
MRVLLNCIYMGMGLVSPTKCCLRWKPCRVPLEKRSRALSLIYSGHQIGSILSLLISPFLLNSGGAPLLFSVYGSLGFVWLLAWHPLVQADPQHQQLGINKDKGQLGPASPVPSLSDVPLARFCRSKAVWAIAIAHSNFGNTYSIIIAWLPTFYSETLGLDMKHSAWCSILPWAAMAAGTLTSGYIADKLIAAKNLNTSQVRKLLQSLGCCGPAACFLYLACSPSKGSLHGAVLSLSLAMGLLGLQAGGFGSNHQDIAAARIAPILFGITSFCASMVGSVGVLMVGRVLDVFHSWSMAFFAIASINLATAFLFHRLSSSDLQFE